MSYIPNLRENAMYKLVLNFNYPILEPFRILQNKLFSVSAVDFSPIFAILFLNFIRIILL
ncbi:hypothetical protein JCM1393_28120 [Clostridium carnis]